MYTAYRIGMINTLGSHYANGNMLITAKKLLGQFSGNREKQTRGKISFKTNDGNIKAADAKNSPAVFCGYARIAQNHHT
jgi:hypothetical protein